MRDLNRRDLIKLAGLASVGIGLGKLVPFPLAWAEELPKIGFVCPNLSELVFFGPRVVGSNSGFFKQRGFDVKVVETTGGGDAARVFSASNEMNVLLGAPASTVKAIMKGEKWKVVANWFTLNVTYYVLKDSPIKTVQDLKGKKVGFTSPASVGNLVTILVLEKAGILDSVKLMPVGGLPEIWTALKGGLIDCGTLDDPFAVPIRTSGEARAIIHSIDYVHDISGDFIVVKESFLKEKPEVLRKFLLAMEESARLFIDPKDRKRIAELWAKGAKFPVDILMRTLQDTPRDMWNLRFTNLMLRQTEDGMKRFKMIDEPIVWSKIIDQSCLPENLRLKLPS